MKSSFFVKLVSLILGVVAAVGVLAAPLHADTPAPASTVTVSGRAEIQVDPDHVLLTVGVETLDRNMDTAKADNDRVVSAVLDAARKLGVEEKHLKTTYLGIDPRYKDARDPSTLLGYTMSKRIVITLGDLDKFEALLASALEAGANHIHGIEFRTTELRKYRDEARLQALDAAKEKAEAMAKRYGQNIGAPLMIKEGDVNTRWPAPSPYNVSGEAPSLGGAAGGPTVPGQITISAIVTVQFELVD